MAVSLNQMDFCDGDYAGDPIETLNNRLVYLLGKNPISWSDMKQPTITRSSTEAE